MNRIPDLFNNPSNPSFHLEEKEIYNIKEARELIEIEKFSFSLFAIYSCVIINLQRRVEFFGIESFIKLLKDASLYNKDLNTLKERWININDIDLIDNAKKLNLINNSTAELIKTLYWMKADAADTKNISKEEIYAIVFLLEKNLFLNSFKEDQRETSHNFNNEMKRRKEDNEAIVTKATTHQELILKSGVEHFKNNLETNNKNDKLITAYM